jgi:hypothetical protein
MKSVETRVFLFWERNNVSFAKRKRRDLRPSQRRQRGAGQRAARDARRATPRHGLEHRRARAHWQPRTRDVARHCLEQRRSRRRPRPGMRDVPCHSPEQRRSRLARVGQGTATLGKSRVGRRWDVSRLSEGGRGRTQRRRSGPCSAQAVGAVLSAGGPRLVGARRARGQQRMSIDGRDRGRARGCPAQPRAVAGDREACGPPSAQAPARGRAGSGAHSTRWIVSPLSIPTSRMLCPCRRQPRQVRTGWPSEIM